MLYDLEPVSTQLFNDAPIVGIRIPGIFQASLWNGVLILA